MKIEDAKAVVTVATNISRGCPFLCGKGGLMGGSDRFEEAINHLISEHGCTLVHVGTDTTHGNNGELWHATLATLASSTPLPALPPLNFQVIPAQP